MKTSTWREFAQRIDDAHKVLPPDATNVVRAKIEFLKRLAAEKAEKEK